MFESSENKNPADIAINRAQFKQNIQGQESQIILPAEINSPIARPALPLAIATSCLTPLSHRRDCRFFSSAKNVARPALPVARTFDNLSARQGSAPITKGAGIAGDVITAITLSAAVNPVAYDNSSAPDHSDVADRASDSEAMLPYWNLSDDLVAGIEALVARGKEYMPMFPKEKQADYDFRLSLAKFTNIYRDTVEGLASKPFEEEVSIAVGEDKVVPEAIEQFCEDVDGAGGNLTDFASAQFFNGINSAVSWIFVDEPVADSTIVTKADANRAGLRPYWSHVMARNVLEAKSRRIDGKDRWILIRLFEPGKPNRVRVMRDTGTAATWELYEESETTIGKKKNYILVGNGTFGIGYIPMVMFATGRRDGKRYFFRPPMRDSADLSRTLYKNESGLEYAKTMSAFSMLAGQGVNPPKEADGRTPQQLSVGPQTVLYAPPHSNGEAGRWEFISPDSANLTFLATDIEKTQQQLRELGRQPLTAQSGNLTTVAAATAANKSRSAVAAWANSLKNALENAMVMTCDYLGIQKTEYDPEINVYSEFDNFVDAEGDVTTIQTMREKGDLSQDTYWFELQRRRILSSSFDPDAEKKRLADEAPPPEEEYDAQGNVIPVPTKLKVIK